MFKYSSRFWLYTPISLFLILAVAVMVHWWMAAGAFEKKLGALKGRERSLAGGYIPFPKTKAERLATGDPRLSIEERYPSAAAYYGAAVKQTDNLVQQRLLLPEDAIRLLNQMMTELETSRLLQHP